MRRVRSLSRQTMIGPVLVVWTFGYVLVDIVAFLIGRTVPGANFLSSVPILMLGVGQTLALQRLREALAPRLPVIRWLVLGMGITLATAIQAGFDLYWLRWLALTFLPDWQAWALNINLQRLMTVGILYLWTFCLSLTLLWAMHVRGTAQAAELRAASAETAAAKAEAAALRLQLNPHFMFNALNSISSLVLVDRKNEAEEMILRLCEFLRGSLHTDPMADVPLAQEMDVIHAYLDIEAARFGDDLAIEIAVDPDLAQTPVPNFILQPLVENAIKHGIARRRRPSTIKIEARGEPDTILLSVTNSIPETGADNRPSAHGRAGIGLANIRQRLVNRYGEQAQLDAGAAGDNYCAIIRLPLFAAH